MRNRFAMGNRVGRGTIWALLLTAAFRPALAQAQDAKPVVVAAFHSYQRFLDHLAIIGKFSGLEKFAASFDQTVPKLLQAEGLKVTDLPGVDRGRPMGLLVLPGDEAQTVLFLPVTDFAAALAGLQPLTGEATDAGDGLRGVTLLGQSLMVKEVSGWAMFSPQAAALANPPTDPGAIVGDMLQKSDAALRLNLAGVTAEQRQDLVDSAQGLLGAGLQQQAGETDGQFTLRKTMSEQQLGMMQTLLMDAEQVDVDLRIDAESGSSIGDLSLKPASGSVSAAHIAAFGAKPSRVGGMFKETDALALHLNLGLDEGQIKKFSSTVSAYREAVREGLAASTEAGEPEHRKVVDGLVDKLFDAMKSSIEAGQLNVAARVKQKGFPMTLVLGTAVESSANLDAVFREFGALAQNDPGFTKVELDVAKQGDVAIHGFELQKEKPAPGAKPGQLPAFDKVFKTRQIYVAAAGDRAFVALGPKALDDIKEALTTQDSNVDPIHLSMNTSLMVSAGGMLNPDPTMGMAVSLIAMNLTAGADGPMNDRFIMTMKPSEGGLAGHMEMGNGLLRVIGVILPLLSQFAGGAGS